MSAVDCVVASEMADQKLGGSRNESTFPCLEIRTSDVSPFVPSLSFLASCVLAVYASFVIIVGVLVQRAVFRLLLRLQGRHINSLIIANQFFICIWAPIYSINTSISNFYYPLVDIFGSYYCFFMPIFEFYGFAYTQLQSFFLAFFRFVFITQTQWLSRWNVRSKNFGLFIILIHFLTPFLLILTTSKSFVEVNSGSHNICIGRYEQYFPYSGSDKVLLNKKPCEGIHGIIPLSVCYFSTGMYLTMASNLCEVYFYGRSLWECKRSTDKSASMMTNTTLMKRRRDDGIVMAITIWQWVLELAAYIVVTGAYYFFMGMNRNVDKVLIMTYIFYVFAVQPSSFLFGDSQFRIDVVNCGFHRALINALKQKYN